MHACTTARDGWVCAGNVEDMIADNSWVPPSLPPFLEVISPKPRRRERLIIAIFVIIAGQGHARFSDMRGCCLCRAWRRTAWDALRCGTVPR